MSKRTRNEKKDTEKTPKAPPVQPNKAIPLNTQRNEEQDSRPKTPPKVAIEEEPLQNKAKGSPFKRQRDGESTDVGGRDSIFYFRPKFDSTANGEKAFVAVKSIGEIVYKDRNNSLATCVTTSFAWLDTKNQQKAKVVHGPNIVKQMKAGEWYQVTFARLSFNELKEVGNTKLFIDYLSKVKLVSNAEKNAMLDKIKVNSTPLLEISVFFAQASGYQASMVVRIFSLEIIEAGSLVAKAKVYDENGLVEVLIFKQDHPLTRATSGDVFFINGKVNHKEEGLKKITTVTMQHAFKITKNQENEMKYKVPPKVNDHETLENVSANGNIEEALRNREGMNTVVWYPNVSCRINTITDDFAVMTCEKCQGTLETLTEGLTCTNLHCSENNKIADDNKVTFRSAPKCELAICEGFAEETVTAKICKNQEMVVFGVTAKQLCLGVKPIKPFKNITIKATLGISKKSILVNKIERIVPIV